MKTLAEYILTKIVDHPKDVKITEEKEEDRVSLKIKVNPLDLPKVIGKGGKVIKSIRNLLKIAARKQNLWINLELIEH